MILRRQRGGFLARSLLAVPIVVVLTIGGLLFAPAGLAARIVEAAGPDVRLLAPSGRIADGSANLVVTLREFGRLDWTLAPGALGHGHLAADLALRDSGHELTARAAVDAAGYGHAERIAGSIRERSLDALLAPYDIDAAGTLVIADGYGAGDVLARRLDTVQADLEWTGGAVRYVLGGTPWVAEFPPLRGRLRSEGGRPVLRVHDANGEELLSLTVRAEGWVDIAIRYRFIALAGYPWPVSVAPETVVLEISEQLR